MQTSKACRSLETYVLIYSPPPFFFFFFFCLCHSLTSPSYCLWSTELPFHPTECLSRTSMKGHIHQIIARSIQVT